MLTHTARGTLQMLLSLTVKTRKGQWVLFLLEERMQLSPPLPQGHEKNRHLCFDSACLWLSLVNCCCFIISCERKEVSFPVVKKVGKDCHCRRRLNFSWVLFVKNESRESFSSILGDPLYLN